MICICGDTITSSAIQESRHFKVDPPRCRGCVAALLEKELDLTRTDSVRIARAARSRKCVERVADGAFQMMARRDFQFRLKVYKQIVRERGTVERAA